MRALLIAVTIFAAYILASIFKNKGIPQSISYTYYVWKESRVGWLFTAFMAITGSLLWFAWQPLCTDNDMCLAFLSCAAMWFVGGACAYLQTLTKTVHYTSAAIWAGSAIAWNIVVGNVDALLYGIAAGFVGFAVNAAIAKKAANKIFWAEIACVAAILIGVGKCYL